MDVMIDIETLSTKSNALVATVAARLFDPLAYRKGLDDPCTGEALSLALSWEPQAAAGRHIDPGTVAWWLQQSDQARAALFQEQMAVKPALEALAAFTAKAEGCAWANGPEFDLAILSSLFEDFGMTFPVKYWRWQSVRTARLRCRNEDVEALGSASHEALADVDLQIKIVCLSFIS